MNKYKDFDNYLKEEFPDLYADLLIVGRWRSRALFRTMRITNFRGYRFAATIIRMAGF